MEKLKKMVAKIQRKIVSREFITYVEPLIQGDVAPIMVNGIPRHLLPPKELYKRY